MTAITRSLHCAFTNALRHSVLWHSELGSKPLCVDLALPLPPKLRVYLYSLIGGVGTVRPTEYKIVLRVPGQKGGTYASFDYSDGRFALLVGYRQDLDVFVLWDASLHHRFTNGCNVQVRDVVVHTAAVSGRGEQARPLSSGVTELVIACQSWNLSEALYERLALTGGMERGQWAASRN